MISRVIILLFVLVMCGMPCIGKTVVVDAPIVENIRFFKLPDSYKGIAFNFDESEYAILQDLHVCGYGMVSEYGRFTVESDSVIIMDRDNERDNMIIAMKDGDGTGIGIEAFDSATNRSLPFSSMEFMFGEGEESCLKLWNFMYEPYVKDAMVLDTGMPSRICLRTNINYIVLNLNDDASQENTVRYYPVYKLQNKPVNKIMIYVDCTDYGSRSSRYELSDGKIYLVTGHGKRELEEIVPGAPCATRSKRFIGLDERWPINFQDSTHVAEIGVKEIF